MKKFIWVAVFLASVGSSYAGPPMPPNALPVPTPTPPEQWTVKIQTGTDGQEVWISNNTTMTTPVEFGTLSSVPKGTLVFHWGPVADVDRWRSQGTIDQGELDAMINGSGAEGGGFYFSRSITDTTGYGPRLLVNELVQDIQALTPTGTTYINVDAELAHELAQAGISAIENYNGTDWMNIIDLNGLRKFWAPSFQTFAQNTDLSSTGLSTLFQFDANAPLDMNDPKLASNPVVVQLKSGKFPGQIGGNVDHPGGTPFFNLVKSAADAQMKGTYDPLFGASWKPSPFSYTYTDFQDPMGISHLSSNFRIPMSAIDPGSSLSNPISATSLSLPFLLQQEPQYFKNLVTALQALDFNDLAEKIAANDSTPWTAYDVPGKPDLAGAWQKVQNTGLAFPFDDSTLGQINQIFTGAAAVPGYRDSPLVAGGNIQIEGKGYYRISAHQKAALESNPLLVAEVIPDPSQPGEFLARHEYPSAATYSRFRQLLSAGLLSKLDAAKAAGTLLPGSADFKSLTQSIITELMTGSTNIASFYSLKYQVQMAIQPFAEDNELTLRAQYSLFNPIFLKDSKSPFLMTPYEFYVESQNGTSQYNRIVQGWLQIQEHEPRFPQYFSSPDFWAVAQNMQTLPSDAQSVVSAGQKFYTDPANLKSVRDQNLQFFDDDLSACDKALTTH